jgi:pilus assembly protein Flp/PilA
VAQTPRFVVQGASTGPGPRQVAFAALRRLTSDDSGQDMIEYALVASFIGLGTVAGVNGLASKIAGDLNLVLNGFNAALAGHS